MTVESVSGTDGGGMTCHAAIVSRELRIPYLTLYAFSTENWQRPRVEVDALMRLLRRFLQAELPEAYALARGAASLPAKDQLPLVRAALQEDAQGIAVSSYQGGHVEFFKYMLDLLKARGGDGIQVFGGGGGVIVPAEIRALAERGVRIFTVGIGTAEGELLQIQTGQGQTDYVRDEQGNVVKSRLNESLLQQIAGATDERAALLVLMEAGALTDQHDLAGGRAEHLPQCRHLRGRAATAGRRERLVRDEHRARGDRAAVDAEAARAPEAAGGAGRLDRAAVPGVLPRAAPPAGA